MLQADGDGFTLPAAAQSCLSVDVYFAEQRVFSLYPADHPQGRVSWPAPIRGFLRGSTQLHLRDSATGEALASGEVRFTQDDLAPRLVDEAGRALSINKWGYLAPTLGGADDALSERLLTHAQQLIALLQEMGFRPFVVGGTLLGAVRDGALLPHDDDADIAYLSSHSHPADVAIEGLQLQHDLASRGFEMVRHSAAHTQLIFRSDTGLEDHHIDIFAAYFDDDGNINQPFHVRGPLEHSAMLPFSTVRIGKHSLPAPRLPEEFLRINYDDNWRIPQPGFKIETPESTRQRFLPWFGANNHLRDDWNEQFATRRKKQDVACRAGARWVATHERELTSPALLEVGAGTGRLASRLATAAASRGAVRHVYATDYAREALRLIRDRSHPLVSAHHLNLSRLDAIALPRQLGITGAFDLVANHVLEVLPVEAVPQLMRLARMSIASGGRTLITVRESYEPQQGEPGAQLTPTTGTMSPAEVQQLAAEWGLTAEVEAIDSTPRLLPGRIFGVRLTLPGRKEQQ